MGATTEKSAIFERQRLLAFAFAAADILLQVDSDGTVEFATGSTEQLWGKSHDALVGTTIKTFITENDRAVFDSVVYELARPGRILPKGLTIIGKDGKEKPAQLGGFRLDPSLPHYFLTLSLLSADRLPPIPGLKRTGASGMLDEDSFKKRVENYLARAQSEGMGASSLFLVDGLPTGAELDDPEVSKALGALGQHLRSLSVGGDMGGDFGDGKFGLVTQSPLDADTIKKIESEIGRKLEGTVAATKRFRTSSVDIDPDVMQDQDLTDAVMHTLNKFKELPPGQELGLKNVGDAAKNQATETWDKVMKLREMIEFGQLDLAFQPIVDIKTNKIHHFEALTRTIEGGSPFELVCLAEDVGMIMDFDLVIIDKVLHTLATLLKEGKKPKIGINVSGHSLQSKLFMREMLDLIHSRSAITPQLSIEITETAQIKELGALNDTIQSIRDLGITVSLDDFGTGTTSFESLRALEVDFVKIDGSYVQGLNKGPRHIAFLKQIVDLCNELKLPMIAEYVETESDAEQLAKLGVQYGQGWLYGKPRLGRDGLLITAPENVGLGAKKASGGWG